MTVDVFKFQMTVNILFSSNFTRRKQSRKPSATPMNYSQNVKRLRMRKVENVEELRKLVSSVHFTMAFPFVSCFAVCNSVINFINTPPRDQVAKMINATE
jgi:hypothetical protein